MRKLALSLLVIVLSACGGGSDAPQATAQAVVQVDGYGDSTTEGLGDSVTPLLQGRAVFTNRGISASSISDLLRTNLGSEMERPARLVTLNHALNSATTDPAKVISVDEYRRQITAFVREAQRVGKRVILETPNPAAQGGIHSYLIDFPKLDAMAQTIRDVAAETGSPLCDQFAAINAAGMGKLEYLTDGFHPDVRLYEFKAAYLAACIAAAI